VLSAFSGEDVCFSV